jgi:hypothetical protein
MPRAVTAAIYRAHVVLTGTTGLVLNNIRLADPEDPVVIERKQITGKRQMTSEDRERAEFLQWNGSLYEEAGQIIFPVVNVLRSVQSIAAAFRDKTRVERGVSSAGAVSVPLQYNGPSDLQKLYEDPRFRFRTMVNGNPSSGKKAMVPSLRPVFPEWRIELGLIVFNDVLGWDQFAKYVELAGSGEGIGNARKLGYGRFTAEISKSE